MNPSFFCVGAQKAGTTSLHNILNQHPAILLPKVKETKFFIDDEKYKKGIEQYKSNFFLNTEEAQVAGEIDPDYMVWEQVPERMFKCLGPNIKIIFVFRNPVDRAYSHYWMCVRRNIENLTFEEAIEEESTRIRQSMSAFAHFSYIERGMYSKQVNRFLDYFPRENMRFYIFESDFLKFRENMVHDIVRWLGVEHKELDINDHSNKASKARSSVIANFIYQGSPLRKLGRLILPVPSWRREVMKKVDLWNRKPFVPEPILREQRKLLFEKYFLEDIIQLEKLLGMDLSFWYKYI